MSGIDNGFVLSHTIAFSPMIQRFIISLRFVVLSALLASMAMASTAWAYKVEKYAKTFLPPPRNLHTKSARS